MFHLILIVACLIHLQQGPMEHAIHDRMLCRLRNEFLLEHLFISDKHDAAEEHWVPRFIAIEIIKPLDDIIPAVTLCQLDEG